MDPEETAATATETVETATATEAPGERGVDRAVRRIEEMRAAVDRGESPLRRMIAERAAAGDSDEEERAEVEVPAAPEPAEPAEAERSDPTTDVDGSWRDESGRLRDASGRFVAESAATEGDPPAEASAEPAGDPAPDPALVVELPAREAGGEPHRYVARDQNEADRLRQAIREGMRRDEFNRLREPVEQMRREYEAVIEAVQTPEGAASFLLEQMPAATRLEAARLLLASLPAEEFDAVVRQADEWIAAPVQRDEARLRAERAAFDRRRQNDAVARQRAAALPIIEQIDALVPAAWDDRRAMMFARAATAELAAYAQETGQPVGAAQVAEVLRGRGVLETFGLNGQAATPAPAAPASAPAPAPAAAAPSPSPEQIRRAREAPERIRSAAAARRAASATAPAGAGAATAGGPLPAGQGVMDRIATLRRKWLGE